MALDTPFPVGVHLGCLHTGRLRGDKDGCPFAEDAVGLLAGSSGSGLQDTRVLPKHPAPRPRQTHAVHPRWKGRPLPAPPGFTSETRVEPRQKVVAGGGHSQVPVFGPRGCSDG